MAKFVSPLLGYNNNVRHKNRVFHIQTEDSGVNHPHIITHLFMDGGRILKSVKKSYAEHVGAEGMTETVRQMMKEQHKAMFIALRDGQFDHLVEPTSANSMPPKEKPVTASAAPPPASAAASSSAGASSAVASAPGASAHVASTTSGPAAVASAPAGSAAAALAAAAPARPEPIAAVASPAPPLAAPVPAPRLVLAEPDPESAPATTRQLEPPVEAPAVAVVASVPPGPADRSLFRANDLPPPAKGAVAKEPRPDAGRYAAARPAAIFGTATKTPSPSIFTDDLVSDKSLDEVILSYLAEDLEPPRRK